MLTAVHRGPGPFVAGANTIRVTVGARCRTGMIETKTETTVVELQAISSCLRGALEPLACILGSSPEFWLGV